MFRRLLSIGSYDARTAAGSDLDCASEDDARRQIEAIGKSQAIIHFAPNGTILYANQNFLDIFGYRQEEIVGLHHSIFVDADYARSSHYREFWEKLGRGEFDIRRYKRLGKNGREVWIRASYNPVLDQAGRVQKVIKFASDITEQMLENADFRGQIAAINKTQAVIHFSLDGTILEANKLFLDMMGYEIDEIRGKHHRIFVDAATERSAEYKQFWENLRTGHSDSKIYARFGKYGKRVWIQAAYNPIFDMNGKPFKIVKFATEVTDMIDMTENTGADARSVVKASAELSASNVDIGRNMVSSSETADTIMHTTLSSEEAATRLIASMKLMEKTVRLIRELAGRVNILALNAAIEAARAGEAGRGFAIVATEVKNMYEQTEAATDQIATEIGVVQSISSTVAESVRQTLKGVKLVNEYVSHVSSAIEQQSDVIHEISERSLRTAHAVTKIIHRVRQEAVAFHEVSQ